MAGKKVLVVDDDAGLLTLMRVRLGAEGYHVVLASNADEALARAREEFFDLVITDLKMAGKDGLALLEEILLINPVLPVIILTAHGTIASAVEAMKKGAYSYLTKPFDHKELLLHMTKALETRRLREEITRLKTLVRERCSFENIVATSQKMQDVLRAVSQIAPTDSTVCLYGESGTGKELVAKAIHASSSRAESPFVVVNCGAIPEGLLENELFGHVKGAYTGADHSKGGLFRQADGGTFFLDEIGELPAPLQVKLLRVLQEKEFYPLGAAEPTKVDIRFVVATNKDLAKEVQAGRFREDLYYRIQVIPIQLPPLRERKEDIPPLAHHFLRLCAEKVRRPVRGFSSAALQRLMLYDWPGNVRELANVVERAVAIADQDIITPELLFMGAGLSAPSRQGDGALLSLKDARREFEKEYLRELLTVTRGNVSRAAELAGKYRADFYRLLKKYALEPDAFKTDKPVGGGVPHP